MASDEGRRKGPTRVYGRVPPAAWKDPEKMHAFIVAMLARISEAAKEDAEAKRKLN